MTDFIVQVETVTEIVARATLAITQLVTTLEALEVRLAKLEENR